LIITQKEEKKDEEVIGEIVKEIKIF